MLSNEIEAVIDENWMKRYQSIDFMPATMNNNNSLGTETDTETIYMDVGINGGIFSTVELSKHMI